MGWGTGSFIQSPRAGAYPTYGSIATSMQRQGLPVPQGGLGQAMQPVAPQPGGDTTQPVAPVTDSGTMDGRTVQPPYSGPLTQPTFTLPDTRTTQPPTVPPWTTGDGPNNPIPPPITPSPDVPAAPAPPPTTPAPAPAPTPTAAPAATLDANPYGAGVTPYGPQVPQPPAPPAPLTAAPGTAGPTSLGYNVNQMPAGWWNGAGNDNANGTFNGPIPVNQLTTDDTAFLAAAARIMGGGFDPRNIASGDHNSVSAALGSDTMKGLHAAQHDTAGFLANRVSPQVRAAMEQMVAQNPAMQARWNQFISQSDGSGHGSRNEGLVQKHQADSMAQTAATSAAATAYARAHPGQVSSNTMNPYNVPQPPTAPNPLNLPGQGGARPDATGGGFLPTASANDISKQYKKPKLGKVNTMQPTRGTA